MPPIRSMSNIKPVKTERTHEENQERAYIAASRRSDRSLEARVESARRASEIHKRRTGRSLRVTEQDVVNEEMYEEEDDDLPMQYRRLTAHLQTSNADFTRRLQAYVAQHVEMRTALGQAIAGGWQGNQSQQNSTQFMNPSFMQMQSSGLPNPMLPPQMLNRSPSAYRQTPYPIQNMQQSVASNQRGRSMSNASPHDFASFNQQHSQSAQTTPVDTMKMDERRMSLPPHNVMPQIPQSQHGAQQSVSPDHQSPVASRTGSSTNLAAVHGVFKHPPRQSPQSGPTPSQQHQQSFSSPSSTNPNYMQDISPLTTMMPLNDQQLLATSPDMNDPFFDGTMLGLPGMKSQQPFYSYNPNGKPKNGSGSNASQTTFDGLSQTLMPSQLEIKVSSADMFASPNSSVTDSVLTPYSGDGFGFSYDGCFNGFEPLRAVSSNNTSGQITPAENESQDISGWLDNGVYEDNVTTNATA